ncbi:gas vesicle protein [Alkalicoccus daliensis]|nr:gas vesicle protein [Alkalicoccus daliensis]
MQPANLSNGLVEILETVLDKGVVIAGDISINLQDVELLTIKIRLVVASVDKAKEVGIDWWESDPLYSTRAVEAEKENELLKEKIHQLEARIGSDTPTTKEENDE